MEHWGKRLFGSRTAQAKVVRWNKVPCLIATFKASTPPMVWQTDLEKLTNYTLKLNHVEGEWDLGYALQDGAFKVIAHFEDLPSAQTAFDVVQEALLSSGMEGGKKVGLLGKILMGLGIFFILITAFQFFTGRNSAPPQEPVAERPTSMLPERGRMRMQEPMEPQAAQPERFDTTRREIQTGVPMNADEVLPLDAE